MAMNDNEFAAAELALGLTPRAERQAKLARLEREPAFAGAVEGWEQRLACLADLAPPGSDITPPAGLLEAIERRIDSAGALFPGTFTIRPERHTWITVGDGVTAAVLMRNPRLQRNTVLLRCEPGATYPSHEHDEDEELFILEGDLVLGAITLSAGDYHFAPKGRTHPDAYSRSGCLILVSAAA